MKYIIKLPLILLIILSLVSGIRINGDFELLYLSKYNAVISINRLSFVEILILLLLLISHLLIFSLPFLTKNEDFYTVLALAPPGFVLFYFILNVLSIFALIPFVILWLICLFLCKEIKSVSNSA